MPVWQVSGAGSDQKADSGIHWTVFIGRGHDPRGIELEILSSPAIGIV